MFGLFHFKAGCLLFWFLWFSLAFLSNLFDFIYAMEGISDAWLFRSGNYTLLAHTISIYHLSNTFLNALFICDISVQLISAILFFCAFISWLTQTNNRWLLVNIAFAISIGLWGVFIIMEEFFIAYKFEGIHINLFLLELLTLLSIHILVDIKMRDSKMR